MLLSICLQLEAWRLPSLQLPNGFIRPKYLKTPILGRHDHSLALTLTSSESPHFRALTCLPACHPTRRMRIQNRVHVVLTFVPSAYPSAQLPDEWMNNVWMTHGERGNSGTLLTSTLINLTSDLYEYTGLPSSIEESPACPSSTLSIRCRTAQCSRRRLSRTLLSQPQRSSPKQSFSIPESL